eukprot:7383031-Prymnesium_polylepis.1
MSPSHECTNVPISTTVSGGPSVKPRPLPFPLPPKPLPPFPSPLPPPRPANQARGTQPEEVPGVGGRSSAPPNPMVASDATAPATTHADCHDQQNSSP